VLPFLAVMTHHCKNRELTVAMTAAYDLSEEHVSFITGSGKTTNKVESVVEDAQELRDEEAVEHSGGAFEGATRTGDDESLAGDDEPDGDAAGDSAGGEGDGLVENGDGGDGTVDAEDDENQSGLDEFF
jgi:replication factor C large subunit